MKHRFLFLLVLLTFCVTGFARAPLRFITGQAATSTAASLVVADDPTRTSILIRNLDASISVYVGTTSGVTSSTGMLIKAGEALTINSSGRVYVIAASATPSIAYLTENE